MSLGNGGVEGGDVLIGVGQLEVALSGRCASDGASKGREVRSRTMTLGDNGWMASARVNESPKKSLHEVSTKYGYIGERGVVKKL
jgi:hypothetical protein